MAPHPAAPRVMAARVQAARVMAAPGQAPRVTAARVQAPRAEPARVRIVSRLSNVNAILGLGSLCVLGAFACEDLSYRDIGAQISVLTKRTDSLVPRAQKRLASHGKKAIVQIETALHTAPLPGRLNLIAALDAIGDDEGVPVLRHLAIYDAKGEARQSAEGLLRTWGSKPNLRGERARRALTAVAELRAAGERPLPAIE